VLMCILRATVSAVSCLVVPAFICIDLLISRVLKINDDDDDELPGGQKNEATLHFAEYLENCQRHLHDILHTSRLVYTEHVHSLQV